MWIDTFKDVVLPLKDGQNVFDLYYDPMVDSFQEWDSLCTEYDDSSFCHY
jgi:hypothetical protein